MANNTNTRRTHSSPGVYFTDSVQTYSSKSLGITTLGVAGETLKGPAFQPVTVETWRDFQNYFGGTSTEKYRGSQYPKYELPYIAKTYLEQSQQLEVVRTLGLSGVNAGPAWVITATKHEIGSKYIYNGIAYMPVDDAEYEWVEGVNSFGINDELPCPIAENPTEESPAYYRQVSRINREETDCPENYNWIDSDGTRTYTDYNELAKDEHIDGYIRYQSGYEYDEITNQKDIDKIETVIDWKKDTNWFCEFPSFVPDAGSEEYIKVNCDKKTYVEGELTSDSINWHPDQNWFPEIPVDRNVDKIRVTTTKWVIVKESDTEPTTSYMGDYVMYNGHVYHYNDGSYTLDPTIDVDSDSNCENGVFPNINYSDEEKTNKVYCRNQGYTYGDVINPPASDAHYNFFYTREDVESWYMEPNRYDASRDQYAMLAPIVWIPVDKTTYIVENAVDYGYNFPEEGDKGSEYIKLVSEFHYGCCTNCDLEVVTTSDSEWKISIPEEGQTSTYKLSNLTSKELDNLVNFNFVDNDDFANETNGYISRIDQYNNGIPADWIMIGNQLFKLTIDCYDYFERTPDTDSSDAVPFEAHENCLCKAMIAEDKYYDNVDYYRYYKLSPAYTCFEVSPVYRYYMLVQGTGQLQTEDKECCEDNLNTVVAVLRSRGEYKKAKFVREPNAIDEENGICDDIYEYDGIEYYAKDVRLEPSASLKLGTSCTPGYSSESGDFSIDSTNYGTFTIVVTDIYDMEHRYSVSLNPTDTNYIYKVIGGNPDDGDAEIFIEELYDVALAQMIDEGKVNAINKTLAYYAPVHMIPKFAPATDIMTLGEANLNKRYVGNRYLYSKIDSEGIAVRYSTDQGLNWSEEADGVPGVVYRVISNFNTEKGKYEFFYGAYVDDVTIDPVTHAVTINVYSRKANFETEYVTPYNYDTDVDKTTLEFSNCIYVEADNMFYIMTTVNGVEDVYPVTIDLNNYKEAFRFSSTPWIVSEIKGSANNVELTKLFRFHTISDGSNSVDEVKVSIENIDPDYGTFDVSVRSFGDTDYSQYVLERYVKCNLVPGDKNYVALRIGSTDGSYEPKSKYITVEVNETDLAKVSTPAGFLGYPIRDYSGVGVLKNTESDSSDALTTQPRMPWFRYNTTLDTELRPKKQYFGVSDIVGIDTDVLKYKGVEAYNGIPSGLTPCFHLDARILNGKPNSDGEVTVDGITQKVTVDGIGGYTWSTVGRGNTTEMGIEPRIGDEATMRGTIYEDKANRKFTVAFYGGWDGWDYYRTSRSNTDDFTYSNYKGAVNKTSGFGSTVDILTNSEVFGLDTSARCLTTDYYAYLAAIKQFSNPKTIDINVIATPGIDYVNNTLLVDEVIEMVEEERSDAVYVVTTPDKPFGAGDSQGEMYTADEAVVNLEGADIDTNSTCTYYPWEKYYDADNNQYIFLPITRDVVKSIAYTDNIAYSWYSNAGYNRGVVSGVAPRKKLKIGEQDTLYDGRINFINSFAKEGDRIWGDKNLQVEENLMNRISKTRLRLRIKKLCAKACIGLIFEPNDPGMAKTLRSTLSSVLDGIKANRGISDYRIVIDTSAEARDRLELPATIWFQPNPLLEYIPIDLVATPQGISL